MLFPLILSVFLSIFGLINLFGIKPNLVLNQSIYILIGFGLYFLFRKINWRFFRDNANFFYWLFVSLLVLTFILGVEVKGSKRWIDLYFLNFQASELFKAFFIVFLANFFSKSRRDIDEPNTLFKSIGYFILPTFIILKQPDLGNALVYVFIFLTLLFFSRVPKKIILYSLVVLTILTPIFWIGLKDYQKQRLTSFINPQVDVSGSGYNMIQAVITVGSGKIFGRGLGYGTQSKLLFLPENHTDFAFSSLTEQLGFFGAFCVIVFYFLITLFLIKKTIKYHKQNDEEGNFKFLCTLGFLSYFIFHILVNIGMNLGILPVTGIVLPLISYGGSAVVGFLLGLSLIP